MRWRPAGEGRVLIPRSTRTIYTARRCLLLLALAALGLAGYFGPWAAHRAAGLVVTGLDLAELVKFLPEVMSGQIPLLREAFYAPLAAGSLAAALLASRRTPGRLLRVLLLLAAAALALAQLPPAWSPASLQQPEFRIQVFAIAACLLAIPFMPLLRLAPDRPVLAVLAAAALIAALWPAWSFWQVRPAIAAAYNTAPPIGWGFVACLIGQAGFAFASLVFALGPYPRRRAAR